MLRYIVKRLLWVIPVIIGVSIIIFTILYFAPGEPAMIALGDSATPETIEVFNETYGYNGTYFERLTRYILGLFKGDLGVSYLTSQPVLDELLSRFSVTMILASMSLIVGIVVGILAGIISAVKKYSLWDTAATTISLFGVSMPIFWQGLMLILIFSVNLKWFPSTGFGGVKSYVLPILTLGLNSAATITRNTRSSMLDVLSQDYIRTAKAKGQKHGKIILKHALKNALIPIITVAGLQFISLLSGSVICESIFSMSGVGKYLVDSVNQRNYASVQGTVIFIAILAAIVNLLTDIIYTWIDPRMKSMFAIYVGKKQKKSAKGAEENA